MRLITVVLILKIGFFVTLVSCSNNSELLTEEEVELSLQLREKFSTTQALEYQKDTILASLEVLDYYKGTDFSPIWISKENLTPAGEELVNLIQHSHEFGFLPEMFHSNAIDKLVDSSLLDVEMLLTNAFFLFTTHVNLGCIDSATYRYTWKKDSLDFDLIEELNRVKQGEAVKTVITSHEPQIWDYQQLKKGLKTYLDSFDLDTVHYSIPDYKTDSLLCYKAANDALLGHQYLDSANYAVDSIFIFELKKFQLQNGLKNDAIVGKWTARALEKTNMDRFYQAALSLEKWRWKKKLPNRYMRVNIPEFNLYFVDSNQVKSKHRVIVGAYVTQTPEFQAKMMRMVTNPFWHVPYSISSTEILYGARKDSAYFATRNYKVFSKNEEVDPKTIDWQSIRQNNFPYRVRQDGGSENSLGKIKFLFPNNHSVFVHDTPGKYLFSNDIRAYSHGCIRVQNPFDLAKSILSLDDIKMEADTLDSLVSRGIQRVIELNQSFDVYIEYFTATGDSTGNIIFHPDIYGRDEKYLKDSFKKFPPH